MPHSLVKPADEIITPEVKAADETKPAKKYGKETRVEYEWRPHPTVCKRFNVPNPCTDTSSKEYGTVRNDKHKAPKFSLFNVLAAGTRFDREKTKSLFDELNADLPVKQGPSYAKTVIIEDKSSELVSYTGEKTKIEFETKKAQVDSVKTDFSVLAEEIKPGNTEEDKTASDLAPSQNKTNVYMQERPDFDMFKAIFENEDDDDDEEKNEAQTMQTRSETSDREEDDGVIEMVFDTKKPSQIESTVPSSIDQIKFKDLSKYLKPSKDNRNDYADEEVDEEMPKKLDKAASVLPEKLKFTQLVKSLASKTEKSDADSSSSSSSSNDSDIEIVYEEKSISSSKKSHKKSSKKKKKKHHKKKKKSKKSSKNGD